MSLFFSSSLLLLASCDTLSNKLFPQPPGCNMTPTTLVSLQSPYEGAIITFVICLAVVIIAFVVKSILTQLHKLTEHDHLQHIDEVANEVAKIKLKLKGDLMEKLLSVEESYIKDIIKPSEPKEADMDSTKAESGNQSESNKRDCSIETEAIKFYKDTVMDLINLLDK